VEVEMKKEEFPDKHPYKKSIILRDANELTQQENELINKADLKNLGIIEAWTANGTNKDLSYATHGLFRYFGKYPPPIASHLILNYSQEGNLIIDPMCGSGTAGVESILLNRKCILSDVNPLSLLLSKVKTTHIDNDKLVSNLKKIELYYRKLTIEEYNFEPVGLRNFNHWFLPETIDSLRGLKRLIQEINEINVKEFFEIMFSATVRKVSRATTQQGRLFLDVTTAKEDALETFVKQSQKGIENLKSLNDNIQYPVEIINNDLKVGLPEKYLGSANLVILHPPYFNAYRYSSINSLELAWLGINHRDINKHEIREYFKVGKAEDIKGYIQDMSVALNNSLSLLMPDGVLGLMIGDTVIKNEYVPTTKLLIDTIDKDKYRVEVVALRVPRFTEATWVASQRRKSDNIGISLYDFIITFRRSK